MASKRTTRTNSQRRRETVQVGTSAVNRSDLEGLRTAWRHKQLVLFLGAGVSLAYGIPSWKNLVLEMLFNQTEHAARMRNLFPNYRRALSSWLADYFEYNPVVLARMIEDDIRQRSKRKSGPAKNGKDSFLDMLRQHLYAAIRENLHNTTLCAIADFIERSSGHIPAIVTFNFDDLLEAELSKRSIEHTVVYTAARVGHTALPIIHPHGFIPRKGDLGESTVVFTERHYHQLTETVFHWALTEIVLHLRHHTVLFIGLSMSDPNLRRLLDACRNSDIPPHWQVQKRHEIHDHERLQVAQEVEHRAREWGKILGDEYIKEPRELLDVMDSTLQQADTYDRQLFQMMGVKTIWLNSFTDIGGLLDQIIRRGAC
jgi:SIR2-like domain